MTTSQIEAENTQMINDMYRLLKKYSGLRNLIRDLKVSFRILCLSYFSFSFYVQVPREKIVIPRLDNVFTKYVHIFKLIVFKALRYSHSFDILSLCDIDAHRSTRNDRGKLRNKILKRKLKTVLSYFLLHFILLLHFLYNMSGRLKEKR